MLKGEKGEKQGMFASSHTKQPSEEYSINKYQLSYNCSLNVMPGKLFTNI